MLVVESGKYKELTGIKREMINTTFDVNVNMVDKTGKKERLAARIERMLESGLITASMAERLDDIENPKDAILYLEYVEKKQQQMMRDKQQRDIQLNAQVQQQSTQIATQGKVQTEYAKAQARLVVEHLKSNDQSFRDLFKMLTDAEKEAAKTGAQLPADLATLKDYMTAEVLQKQMQADQPPQQQQGQPQQAM
jgi:hypothetical protein